MRLSVDDGDQVTPLDSFRRFTQELARSSSGVLGVSVEQCTQENLPVLPDPLDDWPAHTLVDSQGLSTGSVRTIAKRLKEGACKRGWLYIPSSVDDGPEIR